MASLANGWDGPVTMTAELAAQKSDPSSQTLNLLVSIKPGWHIYDVAPKDGSAKRTTVELKVPRGVTTEGSVSRSASLPDFNKPGSQIYKLSAVFSLKIKLDDSFQGGDIQLKLNYQVCNEKLCRPADTLTTSIKVPGKTQSKSTDPFEAPVMLMVGDKPLNAAARQMYPSPAMFDIDNDGHDELIVGDIMGVLNVYENKNSKQSGDPVWSQHTRLNSNDGKPIKVKNW